MSKFSNYTSVFRVRLGDEKKSSSSNTNGDANGDASLNSTGPPIRRSQSRAKSRPVVSCLLCRSRKQKCDRLLPCGTCSRRGDGALCRYGNEGGVSSVHQRAATTASAPGFGDAGGEYAGSPTHRRVSSSVSASSVAASGSVNGIIRHEAQVRLQKLEEMVNRMATIPEPVETAEQAAARAANEIRRDVYERPFRVAFNDPGPDNNSNDPSTRYDLVMPIGIGDDPPSSTGQVANLIGAAPFVGATNWAAVLDSIRDIKSYLGEEQTGGDSSDDFEHVDGVDVEGEEEDDGDDEDIGVVEDMEESSSGFEGPDTSMSTAVGASGSSTAIASTPVLARDPIATPSQLETAETDGIFGAVAATPGLAGVSSSNPSKTSTTAQQPRMPKHMAEAVSCLPSRQVCDRLLAVYFQSSYMTGPFVHMDEFQRAYSRLWRTGNPASAHAVSPMLWVSMLASVLNIGAMISGGRQLSWQAEKHREASRTSGGEPGSNGAGDPHIGHTDGDVKEPKEPQNEDLILAGRLRKLSTRCLLAGDYLSGRTLAIEALLLNAHVRLMQKRDHDATLWATFSVCVRLAQRMGYQQVDAPTGGAYGVGGRLLTPFEKEMRRRAWYFVESFDMLYSFQFGMPTMIHEDETSTDPPNNLRDDDFDEHSAVLPAARPASDYTPALYFSVKLKLIRLLRKVLRFAVWRSDQLKRRDGPANKATIVKLADDLKREYATVPSRLRMPTHIRDCPFSDGSHDIMHRLAIELINHKATCILFRESLSRDISHIERNGGVDAYGFTAAETKAQRQVCLVSALRILDLHTEFEYETRPSSTVASATAGGSLEEFERGRGTGAASREAGRLATDRHMLSTLALHDFLLAATILCLDLIEEGRTKSTRSNGPSPASVTTAGSETVLGSSASAATRKSYAPAFDSFLGGGEPSLEERAADRSAKMDALRRAYALWHEQRLTSRDAAHAARVLGAIVTKLSSEGSANAAGLDGDINGNGNINNTSNNAPYTTELSDNVGDWGIESQLAHREQIRQETVQRERAQRAEKDAAVAGVGTTTESMLGPIPLSFVNSQDLQQIADMSNQPTAYDQQLLAMTQPPPAHLNYAYDWAEPGPFGAALNDPMNVDWNMVDAFLLDRQLDTTDVDVNVWSADLMTLEN